MLNIFNTEVFLRFLHVVKQPRNPTANFLNTHPAETKTRVLEQKNGTNSLKKTFNLEQDIGRETFIKYQSINGMMN